MAGIEGLLLSIYLFISLYFQNCTLVLLILVVNARNPKFYIDSRQISWRIQGKDLLLKLHNLMCSPASPVRGRSQDLTPEAVEEAARLLGQVRKILRDQTNKEDGLRLAFCLEEIVSESKSAISNYHSKKGPHVPRKSVPRTKRGKGPRSSTEKEAADRASSAAARNGDAEESGEEDEEDEEEVEGVEGETVAGGKRGGGDQEVR